MKLFEASWCNEFNYFERYYDTNLKRSIVQEFKLPFEWYEEAKDGKYQDIINPDIKLEKRQGRSTQGRGKHGFINPIYRNIRDNYWQKDAYNLNPRILYLDIETRSGTVSEGFPTPDKALEPISLIQIFDNISETMIVLGLKDFVQTGTYDFNVKFIKCNDEVHLISTYIEIFKKLDPLIIYAWNGSGFDFPYIFNRLKQLGFSTDSMSNHGNVSLESNEFQGRLEFRFNAHGHYYIDLLDVYKKFTYQPRSSYSLDNIGEIELKEKKVKHIEYLTFDDFYTGNYSIPENPTEEQKHSEIYKAAIDNDFDKVKELSYSLFVHYGITDTYLIKRLDDKMKFTSLMLLIADKMGVLLSDTLGTVKQWSQFLANTMYKRGLIVPPKKDVQDPNVVGGYVRDPVVGKHNWVMSVDVNSMYPLLGMVGANMSPETIVPVHGLETDLREVILKDFANNDESTKLNYDFSRYSELLKKYNLSGGINHAVFKKDNLGIIPELVQDIYSSRKAAKKTMFKYQQQKVLIKDVLKHKQCLA